MSEELATGDEFAEIHDELRAVARDLLGKAGRETAIDWSLIARSGWLGLEAPAEFDGADATFAEVAVLLREIGRAAAYGPYPAVAALGLGTLGLLSPNPGRDTLFRDAVAGLSTPILVLAGEWASSSATDTASAPEFRLVDGDGGLRLYGNADFVLDAPAADRLLIPATMPDGTIVVAAVMVAAVEPAAIVTEQPVVDDTRVFGRVAVDGMPITPESVWHFSGDGAHALRRLHDRAAVALACDSLGLSEAMLDATVDYVRVREQFGRPVGSFQAVKHACADMLVQVTVARRLVAAAVRAHVADAPDASAAASMAKAFTGAAGVEVAGKAMQLHGGIGYTWESGIHQYLKRATLNRSLFGSPAEHRKVLARRYIPASERKTTTSPRRP
ncbi:acyl-CoA dehydrogenase family protein [Nocardia sp. NPDC005366]|uniref:acyl-CoA dehydrogenase family protein n=1 Tax=Nocardia sp. NPDC005366 TaxID=3156878 RepID=UPI00339E7896